MKRGTSVLFTALCQHVADIQVCPEWRWHPCAMVGLFPIDWGKQVSPLPLRDAWTSSKTHKLHYMDYETLENTVSWSRGSCCSVITYFNVLAKAVHSTYHFLDTITKLRLRKVSDIQMPQKVWKSPRCDTHGCVEKAQAPDSLICYKLSRHSLS